MEHESIIKPHDTFHDSKNVYVVTELIKDGDLFDCLKKVRESGPLYLEASPGCVSLFALERHRTQRHQA